MHEKIFYSKFKPYYFLNTLQKVVTNDHVLALVKLREEEEAEKGTKVGNMRPKLTRAKMK